MPPRRPARPPSPDIDALRGALARGKIVRVGIAPSGQFPDGATGRVRSIGDPATDGEEYVLVEVPVNGTKDVLPFAPADLMGAPVRRPPASATGAPNGTSPTRTARARVATERDAAAGTEDELFPAPTPFVGSAAGRPGPSSSPSSSKDGIAGPSPARRSTGGAARGRRPPVSITISTSGDHSAVWRVEARIGARIAVRPTVVAPSRVWDIVESLGDEKLSSVVRSLLDDHRRATQARADSLVAQLSLLQDELKSFPAADG